MKSKNLENSANGLKMILLRILRPCIKLVAIAILFGACEGIDDMSATDEIITINIYSFEEIPSKIEEINIASQNENNIVIVNVAKLGITAAQLNMLRQFAETQNPMANVFINFMGLYPSEKDVVIALADWEMLGKPQLFDEAGFRFVTPQSDKPGFGEEKIDEIIEDDDPEDVDDTPVINQPIVGRINIISFSEWDYATQQPDTIVWDEHLADAVKLINVLDYEHTVVLVIEDMAGVPGNRKGLGNTPGEIFQALGDGKLIPVRRTATGQFEPATPIITSYAPANAWTTTSSAGGYEYAPADVSIVGDSIGTNSAWQAIRLSNAAVGPDYIPQFKGDANNEVKFVPIRISDYRSESGGNLRGTYTRAGGTYSTLKQDLAAEQNGLVPIVTGSDFFLILPHAQISSMTGSTEQIQLRLRSLLSGDGLGVLSNSGSIGYGPSTFPASKKIR